MAATLVSTTLGAAVRPQFAKSSRRGSSAPAASAGKPSARTLTVVTRAGPIKFPYMSRDSQRHDKLVALLDAELDTPQGLSKAAQVALAKDIILRGIGLEDPDSLVRTFIEEREKTQA